MKKTIIYAILATLLVGCVATIPQKRSATFNPAEYEPYLKKGSAIITGQAFMKTRGGDVKYGAGNLVYLSPRTTYSDEFYQRVILQGGNLQKADDRVMLYIRTTQADGSGSFEFKDVPAGEYYAYCPIVWEVPSQYGMINTGGWAYSRIRIADGEAKKVILTR